MNDFRRQFDGLNQHIIDLLMDVRPFSWINHLDTRNLAEFLLLDPENLNEWLRNLNHHILHMKLNGQSVTISIVSPQAVETSRLPNGTVTLVLAPKYNDQLPDSPSQPLRIPLDAVLFTITREGIKHIGTAAQMKLILPTLLIGQ